MPDYAALAVEWEELLGRRSALRGPLQFWTDVLAGWRRWDPRGATSLRWSLEECAACWDRGVPLLAERRPDIPRDVVEELLGSMMERLAAHAPDAAEALQRIAEAWDRAEIGP